MAATLDVSLYMQIPVLDAAGLCALGHAMLSAAPKEDALKPAVKAVKKSLSTLEALITPKKGASADPQRSTKVVDTDVDVVWGALYRRLLSLAELIRFNAPRALRAQALLDLFFGPPEGARFLQDDFKVEWQKIKTRRDLIAKDSLEAEITDLAGAEFVPLIASTHDEYGRVLGITVPAPAAEEAAALIAPLRDLQQDIRDLAIAELGLRQKGNSASLKMVQAALKPIDDVRAKQASTRKGAVAAPPPAGSTTQPVANEALDEKRTR